MERAVQVEIWKEARLNSGQSARNRSLPIDKPNSKLSAFEHTNETIDEIMRIEKSLKQP